MQSNGLGAVSEAVADLDIHDGPRDPFAMYDPEPPPAPKLTSAGVIALDITEQFVNAAQQLDFGQLVKDPYFTLFESVAALEIMDPKMDSGYLAPGETMEDNYDFSQALLPEEIIGIIDQLLCHEMAWHMGHPLSQTIFTSLYIDRILSPAPTSLDGTHFDRSEGCSDDEPLTHQVLRAYCLGLLKTCFFVNGRVKSEHFFEEEDFATHTFNRSLLENFEHGPILELLERTGELVTKSNSMSSELQNALLYRLQFRSKFLTAVEAADSRDSQNAEKLWIGLLACLPNLKSSATLGKVVPTSFSAKIQRKLASTVPPRPIVEVAQDAAFSHLERLCRDAAIAVEVLKYYDSHSLMTFVQLFQARKPQPSVYVRTLLQHYIFGEMVILGVMSIRQVLDDDLAVTIIPANKLLDRANDEIEVPTDPRHKIATTMETFRTRAAGPYMDIFRTICQNRCRIRRTFCHTIADWDNLQLDAEELDQDLRQYAKQDPIVDNEISNNSGYSFPLSSWVYFYKLRQMEWIVQMGFELEIYQPDELGSMYWYLQYLAKSRARLLERMRGFVVRSYSVARRYTLATEQKAQYANSLAFINFSTMESTAIYAFADALSCLFVVLARLNLIGKPARPYSNDQQRYEVRMKPFLSIGQPELFPFEVFTKLVQQPEESTLSLLKFAAESLAGAKKGFETMSKLSAKEAYCQGSQDSWIKNVKDCLKACIFTGITISAVKEAVETAEGGGVKLKVEIPPTGKGYHDWWTVPKVIPVA